MSDKETAVGRVKETAGILHFASRKVEPCNVAGQTSGFFLQRSDN